LFAKGIADDRGARLFTMAPQFWDPTREMISSVLSKVAKVRGKRVYSSEIQRMRSYFM
jgi:hypothetical protein